MDATPPEHIDPELQARALRARRMISGATVLMIGVLVLLFVLFHA